MSEEQASGIRRGLQENVVGRWSWVVSKNHVEAIIAVGSYRGVTNVTIFRDLMPAANLAPVSNSGMNAMSRSSVGWKTSIPPLLSAAALVWMLVSLFHIARDLLPYKGVAWFATLVAPLVLVAALILLSRHRRAGYAVAAIGAALPLGWMFLTESRGSGQNSWIAMNASDSYASLYLPYCESRIITAAVLITTLVWAGLRSLPHGWQLRQRPVNQRTWPAFLTTAGVLFYWFATFAYPYREPIIVDGPRPELGILHVKKDWFGFRETRISLYRGTYYLYRNERHLFSYKFWEVHSEGALTSGLRTQLNTIKTLPELGRTVSRAPRSLLSLHGEGWYAEAGSPEIAAFTTENSVAPPRELVELFNEIEGMPVTRTSVRYQVKDVCLGFCYDLKAGLGYRAENQRCSEWPDGKEHCY